ncbi:MAG: hypothetical protein ACJAX5_003035 [Patiriisocius sp.]|jgi:hypothetical protein
MNQNHKELEREASLQRFIRELESEMQRLVGLLVEDRRNHR